MWHSVAHFREGTHYEECLEKSGELNSILFDRMHGPAMNAAPSKDSQLASAAFSAVVAASLFVSPMQAVASINSQVHHTRKISSCQQM
jgi:hypothetical protein